MIQKNYRSLLILVSLIVTSVFISFNALKEPHKIIWSDSEGYYIYLPSVFIHKDFVKEAVRDTAYIREYKNSGKIFTKYTCGVALMQMPFFIIAHQVAKVLDEPLTGLTDTYGRGNAIAALFYFWLGLFFLYKSGIRYFSEKIVIISLIGITLGTNLFYYTFFQPGMSHVHSFCLFSLFLLLTDSIFVQKTFLKNSTLLSWSLLGFIFGMIVLIRPTNIILGLLPLYIIFKKETLFTTFLLKNYRNIFFALFLFLIPFIPQFLYWKYISGDWIIWSYSNESFIFWKEPKLFRVLFDAWNGWILYSPIVILPLWSLIRGRNTNVYFERIYLVIFGLATYIFASWWAWWFGGAFGHRSYVEYLSLLVIPFGILLQSVEKTKWKKYGILVIIFLLCYYNIGLTYAYKPPWDGVNWTYESVLREIKDLFFIQ